MSIHRTIGSKYWNSFQRQNKKWHISDYFELGERLRKIASPFLNWTVSSHERPVQGLILFHWWCVQPVDVICFPWISRIFSILFFTWCQSQAWHAAAVRRRENPTWQHDECEALMRWLDRRAVTNSTKKRVTWCPRMLQAQSFSRDLQQHQMRGFFFDHVCPQFWTPSLHGLQDPFKFQETFLDLFGFFFVQGNITDLRQPVVTALAACYSLPGIIFGTCFQPFSALNILSDGIVILLVEWSGSKKPRRLAATTSALVRLSIFWVWDHVDD